MTNDPLKVAEAKIVELQAELDRLQQFVVMFHALSAAPTPTLLGSVGAQDVSPPLRTARTESDFSTTAEILDAAQTVLQEEGKALLAADIYERLIARGIRIGGKSPKGNLTAKFALRRNVFRLNSASGKWALAQWATSEQPPSPSSWMNALKPAEAQG